VLYARYRVGTFRERLADRIKTLRDLRWSRIPNPIRGPADARNCGAEGAGLFRLANNRLSRDSEVLQLNKIFVTNGVGEDDNERDLLSHATSPFGC
jgi:pyridoxine 5'-phosphate synthase PdxJ